MGGKKIAALEAKLEEQQAMIEVMKKCLVALFKGKASLSKDYFHMTFQLLRRSKEVCFYLKTNRLSNPHYIQ